MQYSDRDKSKLSAGIQTSELSYKEQLLNRIETLLGVTSLYVNNTDRVTGPQTTALFCDEVTLEKNVNHPWISGNRFYGIAAFVSPQYTGQYTSCFLAESPIIPVGVSYNTTVRLNTTCDDILLYDGNARNTLVGAYDEVLSLSIPTGTSTQTGVWQRLTDISLRPGIGSFSSSQLSYLESYGTYYNFSLYLKYSNLGIVETFNGNSLLGCRVLSPLANTEDEVLMSVCNAAGCLPFASVLQSLANVSRILSTQERIISSSTWNNTTPDIIDYARYELALAGGAIALPEITQLTYATNRTLVPENI